MVATPSDECSQIINHSNQKQRWLATALLDIEPRLRRVMGCLHLKKLREAIKRELRIETSERMSEKAE